MTVHHSIQANKLINGIIIKYYPPSKQNYTHNTVYSLMHSPLPRHPHIPVEEQTTLSTYKLFKNAINKNSLLLNTF